MRKLTAEQARKMSEGSASDPQKIQEMVDHVLSNVEKTASFGYRSLHIREGDRKAPPGFTVSGKFIADALRELGYDADFSLKLGGTFPEHGLTVRW